MYACAMSCNKNRQSISKSIHTVLGKQRIQTQIPSIKIMLPMGQNHFTIHGKIDLA